jgi:hypothetical protein
MDMVCTKIETTDATGIGVVWGARNIGRIIGLSEGQTHYLLVSGKIPGAIKRGNRWCIAEAKLREAFGLEAA